MAKMTEAEKARRKANAKKKFPIINKATESKNKIIQEAWGMINPREAEKEKEED